MSKLSDLRNAARAGLPGLPVVEEPEEKESARISRLKARIAASKRLGDKARVKEVTEMLERADELDHLFGTHVPVPKKRGGVIPRPWLPRGKVSELPMISSEGRDKMALNRRKLSSE